MKFVHTHRPQKNKFELWFSPFYHFKALCEDFFGLELDLPFKKEGTFIVISLDLSNLKMHIMYFEGITDSFCFDKRDFLVKHSFANTYGPLEKNVVCM